MTFEGLFLHFIEVNQFVDSPEYDSVKTFDTEEKFQVCAAGLVYVVRFILYFIYIFPSSQMPLDEQPASN